MSHNAKRLKHNNNSTIWGSSVCISDVLIVSFSLLDNIRDLLTIINVCQAWRRIIETKPRLTRLVIEPSLGNARDIQKQVGILLKQVRSLKISVHQLDTDVISQFKSRRHHEKALSFTDHFVSGWCASLVKYPMPYVRQLTLESAIHSSGPERLCQSYYHSWNL